MTLQTIKQQLSDHRGLDSDEIKAVIKFQAFLEISETPFERRHYPQEESINGHIVSDAWIVNKQRTKVLLIEHKALERWLAPGGHADGDTDLIVVAMKEAEEETGVPRQSLKLLSDAPLDVDVHAIPARPQKNAPEHNHYRVSYAFELDETIPLNGNHEVTAVAWQTLDTVRELAAEDKALQRLITKTANL
jgi:8-oxo-dGTP pyrophosphatase MutT (NUDIX family)